MRNITKPSLFTSLHRNGPIRRIIAATRVFVTLTILLWALSPTVAAVAAEVAAPAEQPAAEQPAGTDTTVATDPAAGDTTTDTTATTPEAPPADAAPVEAPVEAPAETAPAATYTPYIATDLSDYAPGQTVVITGGGFAPSEDVQLVISRADGFTVLDHTVAAGADGSFYDTYVVPTDGTAALQYEAIATGLTSLAIALTNFTDTGAVIISPFEVAQDNSVDDPLQIIIAAKVTISADAYDATITLNDLDYSGAPVATRGDAFDDLLIDGDNTPSRALTSGATPLTPGTYYVYWNVHKNAAADVTHVENFNLTLVYAATSGGATTSLTSATYTTTLAHAELVSNDLDFISTAPSAISASVGSTFKIRGKYTETSSINEFIAQAYYTGTVIRLVKLGIYFYDGADPGSIEAGVPAGYAASFIDTPHLGDSSTTPLPAAVSSGDFWVTEYEFLVLQGGVFSVTPYIQTLRGNVWKLDSGFASGAVSGTISGMKFNDANNNGVKDAGEGGLAGWTIYLDLDNSGTLNAGDVSTTTDANGNYGFSNVQSGVTYTVREVQQAGYNQTYPAGGYWSVALAAGQDATNKNFGNYFVPPVGSFSGVKFNDLNGNAAKDGGEPGLAGWRIYIDDNNNSVLDAGEAYADTDVNGAYSFAGLPAGSYTVREVAQAGWTRTFPVASFQTAAVTAGQNTSNINFGNFANFTKTFELTVNEPILGATYFVDYVTDSGGGTLPLIRDGTTNTYTADTSAFTGPVSIISWTWRIMNGGSTIWSKTVTPGVPETLTSHAINAYTMSYALVLSPHTATNQVGESHLYTATVTANDSQPLANLPVYYSVTAPATLVPPAPPQNTSGAGQVTFSVTSASATSATVRAWVNETDGASTAFNAGEATDTGTKDWVDYNVDVTPPTDTNVVGEDHLMTVTLTKDAGSGYAAVVGQTVNLVLTPNPGPGYIYSVNGTIQPPGTMSATGVTQGPGGTIAVVIRTTAPGTSTLTANYPYAVDSGTITATGAGEKTWQYGSVSGMKFNDLNGDGVKDAGEPGLAGWRIYIDENNNSVLDAGELYADTGAAGAYTISGLVAGAYTLREVAQVGWSQTYPAGGTQSATIATGNENPTGLDFGNAQIQYRISVTPASATNDVGSPHTFTVTLEQTTDNWATAQPVVGQSLHLVLATLSGGTATITSPFVGTSGDWPTDAQGQVFVVANNAAGGTAQLTASVTGGIIAGTTFTDTASGTKQWLAGSVAGLKFADLNASGTATPDAGEPGLAGFTITLTSVEQGGFSASTLTLADGTYLFENVPPGTYEVAEVIQHPAQDGWVQTYPIDPATHTVVVQDGVVTTIDSNEDPVNFGNQAVGVITGVVWNDINGDGIQQPGEPVLPGWTVTLYAADGTTVLGTQITGPDGTYRFENLLPGTYYVEETLIGPEWSNTTPLRRQVVLNFISGEVLIAIVDFGNNAPFLPFTPETPGQSLPFTGGLYYFDPALNDSSAVRDATSATAAGDLGFWLLAATAGWVLLGAFFARRRNRA